MVELLDVFKSKADGNKLYMVFEYMEGGDLRQFIREKYKEGLPLDMVLSFAE